MSKKFCVVCYTEIARGDMNACTNRCCGECHRRYCSPGGSTSPGHGLNLAMARKAHANQLQLFKRKPDNRETSR